MMGLQLKNCKGSAQHCDTESKIIKGRKLLRSSSLDDEEVSQPELVNGRQMRSPNDSTGDPQTLTDST